MSVVSLQNNSNLPTKRLWEDPGLTVERNLVAHAQQFGPNSGGGPSPNSMISPFVNSTTVVCVQDW